MERVEPQKNLGQEFPVPSNWRGTFTDIVDRFVRHDFGLKEPVDGVLPVPEETALQIADYVSDYGETLVPLHEDVWRSSVAQWLGDRWDVLVDLCTESEGVSDLVLHCFVREQHGNLEYEIHLVYVP